MKWYYKVVTIPYEASFDETTGEPIPQIVHVYIQDKSHTMAEYVETFEITEDKTYRIALEIVEGQKAAYRIERDSVEIDKGTVSFEEAEESQQ